MHFSNDEYAGRASRLQSAMERENFAGMLLFAQESMYWLTGYDTFGFCFFQCLVVPLNGEPVLLTRAPDLRQARHTSSIGEIRIWKDASDADPAAELRSLLVELGLAGSRLGIELDTHGLTAAAGRAVETEVGVIANLVDASRLVPGLRLRKSAAELECARKAGALADRALEVALPRIHAGGSEAAILAAMQGAVLSAGGDYPGNPFIIGSGEGSLLCRYYSGRRCLDASDQLTLEWSGTWRLYHAARMMTVVIGDPRDEHLPMFDAAREALLRCEEQLRPGRCFGDVFRAHAEALDTAGFGAHRMNACGYSLGARYAPSWMDTFMFYEGNPEPILSGMVLFVHIILMDSDSGSAMCLGRTSVTTEDGPEPINGEEIQLIRR